MGDIFMSSKETERYAILHGCQRGEMTLGQASKLLMLSYRQTKRVWSIFKQRGKEGLVSKKRGKSSPRAYPQHLKREVIGLIETDYLDFGPTLIAEKLEEREGKKLSKETIRTWMIQAGIWQPKQKKIKRIFQRRERRAAEGELVQADGSDHKWFEERGPRCTLLVAIDDATGKITARFEEEETTSGYFRLMKEYIEKQGIPQSLYTDRYSVFKVNQGSEQRDTHFGRALKELGVELIFARTPQAKGRVERANGILQDRLVKELRLQNISTIQEANAFLPVFLAKYNAKFSKRAKSSFNAHRPLKQKEHLEHILCEKIARKVSKNLEISFENQTYQLQAPQYRNRLQGSEITVIRTLNGELFIQYNEKLLDYKILQGSIVLDAKQLVTYQEKKKWKPSKNHPWKRWTPNRAKAEAI